MNGLAFFDTNVLVYADDTSSPEKQDRSIALFGEHLRRGTAVMSLQVLQEYFVAVTRKQVRRCCTPKTFMPEPSWAGCGWSIRL